MVEWGRAGDWSYFAYLRWITVVELSPSVELPNSSRSGFTGAGLPGLYSVKLAASGDSVAVVVVGAPVAVTVDRPPAGVTVCWAAHDTLIYKSRRGITRHHVAKTQP